MIRIFPLPKIILTSTLFLFMPLALLNPQNRIPLRSPKPSFTFAAFVHALLSTLFTHPTNPLIAYLKGVSLVLTELLQAHNLPLALLVGVKRLFLSVSPISSLPLNLIKIFLLFVNSLLQRTALVFSSPPSPSPSWTKKGCPSTPMIGPIVAHQMMNSSNMNSKKPSPQTSVFHTLSFLKISNLLLTLSLWSNPASIFTVHLLLIMDVRSLIPLMPCLFLFPKVLLTSLK